MSLWKNFLLRCVVIGILFTANIFIWSAQASEKPLIVSFLNIGQGDAIFIEAPNGNQMLIDGGRGKEVLRELGKVMGLSDRSIDIVLATHPDADHIGGLPAVFERFDVGMFIEPGVSSDTKVFQALKVAVKDEGLEPTLARRGMNIALDEGINFLILFPDRDVSRMETNEASIVGILTYGEYSFLLTGDAPISTERVLLSYTDYLESDVLKAGHHGSRTSTSAAFVEAVTPQYAIISAGKDNSYGHPHKEVLNTLTEAGVSILSTAEKGTIIFEVFSEEITLK